MPANTIRCPECRSLLNLANKPAPGTKMRCPKCGVTFASEEDVIVAAIQVPPPPLPRRGEDSPRPRKSDRPRRDDEDDDRGPRRRRTQPAESSQALVIGLIAAGVVFLFILMGGVAWFLFSSEPVPNAKMEMPPAEVAAVLPVAKPPLPVQEVAPALGDNMPLEVLHEIKAATAFIRTDAGAQSGTGTGFVIKCEGNSAYVVTNDHVVTISKSNAINLGGLRPREPASTVKAKITVILRSGTPQEQSCDAELLATAPEEDLAVLKIAGVRDLPKPIDFSQRPQLIETMPVFILGFPFGKALATNKGNPALTIGKGTISSLRRDERGELALVQLNGDLNPGNSGGPVVDSQGRLIGVSVATIRGTQIGLAIPAVEVTQMINGRVSTATISKKRLGQNQTSMQGEVWVFDRLHKIKESRRLNTTVTIGADPAPADGAVDVEARLIDPLGKVKGVTAHLAPGAPGAVQPDAQGLWGPIADAQPVVLKIEQQKALGPLNLPPGLKPDDFCTLQLSYVDGDGRVFYTQPRGFRLAPTPVVVAAQPAAPNYPNPPPANPVPAAPPAPLDINVALADLKAPSPFARRKAADHLAKATPNERRADVTQALVGMINDSDHWVRQSVLRALAVWGTPDNLEAIAQALDHQDIFTRKVALEALGAFKDEKSAELIAQRLPKERFDASRALLKLGPVAEKATIKQLSNPEWTVRMEACKILKVIGTRESLPSLETATRDGNGIVAGAAREAVQAVTNRQ